MFQSLKRLALVSILLLGGVRGVFGFALLGPANEAYQVPTIGYDITSIAFVAGDVITVDVGAPKNIGQFYRRNTPTNYYAFDSAFATYFGSNGMAAVDLAFSLYNNLSNVSSYTPGLTEWPTKTGRFNFTAQALGLRDLKSQTLGLLIEQLGLASPDRYTYGLHDRFLPGGAQCPAFEYIVIQRNFDPVTLTYTNVVNGQTLGYEIIELCLLQNNPLAPFEADAAEYTTDPKDALTAVASQELLEGEFYTGLTRDDVGGLRYLYAATNVVNENVESNSVQVVTNSGITTLTTSNLAIFEAQALTNDAAALSNLYPGLIITSTSNFLTTVVTTNVTFFLEKVPGNTAGALTLEAQFTLTTNFQEEFVHTFANVVILNSGGLATETIQQTSVTPKIGAPSSLNLTTTNIISTVIQTPFTNGDFYILPANLCGPFQIVGTPLGQLVSVTNQVQVITGNLGPVPLAFIADIVTTFTNFTYPVHEVDCATNTTGLRQGIEHLTFVRRDFDQLLSGRWDPITNFYHLTAVSNTPVVQTFRRVVTRPDILFTVADLATGPSAIPAVSAITRSVPLFDSTLATAAGQPGPGTIAPGIVLTYNDVGPAFESGGNFVSGSSVGGFPPFVGFASTNSTGSFQWGSFDATTNAPVVYPSTLSLADLESEVYFQILTASPLAFQVGIPVNVPIQIMGGTQVVGGGYTFVTNGITLPAGLSLSTKGVLSGTPTTVGTNSFTIEATDAGQRVTTKAFTIGVTQ